jgi:hypothetical protein
LRIHEKATKNIPTHNAVQRTPRPTLQIRLTPSNQEATKGEAVVVVVVAHQGRTLSRSLSDSDSLSLFLGSRATQRNATNLSDE